MANIVGPDQAAPLEQADLGPHCLPLYLSQKCIFFGLLFYVPGNSYGRVGTVNSPPWESLNYSS